MNCTRKHTRVTGASSGIGRATALRLAAAGQHVYAAVRHHADGDRLVSADAGGEITPVLFDVTEVDQIAEAAAVIGGHATAGLDGLVNNAGYGLACPVELVPLDAFRRQLDVNVTGQLAVTQAMLPLLRRAAGRIVIISTIGVRFNPPFAGPLDAAKAALTGRALYQATFANMLEVMNHREGNGSPPDVAAVTIVRALTASRPRTVYLTGKDSRRLAMLSLLPTPVLDAAKRHVFGLPAPGSLTGSVATGKGTILSRIRVVGR